MFTLKTSVLLLAVATPAWSQQPDYLPRVVITATRVDVSTGANISASSVIDRALIERSGVTDVAELLRLLPGVSIARSASQARRRDPEPGAEAPARNRRCFCEAARTTMSAFSSTACR